ncbi:MAG: type II secretion system protein N [Proteobacteria bacterium]|nr:type II secretion system protein N [Pseudomonadota bacterium]
MKRWQLVALALGAYAIGIIAMAPASLIDAGLEQATQGRLRLSDSRGTLWSGNGQLEMRDRFQRTAVARSVAWRVLPLYFLRGQLRCEVALDQAIKPFPVTVSPMQIEVADADINLPASTLGVGEPKLAPLGLTGDVLLHVTRLAIGRASIDGDAVLQWRGAGSSFTRVSPLGDYELRFDGAGTTVRATLRTLQGPLQLDGQGSWTSGSRPAFLGSARIAPEQQQQLSPLMRMIAAERGDGSFELQLK